MLNTPLFVYGNKHEIHSAIRNITLNALQFTPDNGRIIIDVSTELYTPMDTQSPSPNLPIDGVKLTISDTGCGIHAGQSVLSPKLISEQPCQFTCHSTFLVAKPKKILYNSLRFVGL